MKFRQYILLSLSLLATSAGSCKNNKIEQEPPVTQIQTSKGLLPIVTPGETNAKIAPEYTAKIERQVEKFYQKNWPNNTLNGGFLVAKEGHVIFERYQGIANKEKKILINEETPLHVASVSKVFTATAILKLVDGGKLNLEDKLDKFLPNFPYQKITIRTLLNHRSGLKNYAYFTNRREIWNSNKTLTNQDVLKIIIKHRIPLEFPTDTRFSYSNTNYALLALVIEKVTGFSYPEAMKKMIFEPLGMKHTYVFQINEDKENATPSYRASNQRFPYDFLDGIYGDKNIYSTPRDLLKLDLARRSGHFLNPKLEAEVYTGYSNEHKGLKNYGLGIRMVNWDNNENFYFHNGWWHGNTSSYITMGKEKVTIIALSNKFSRNTYAVRNLAALFGNYPFKLEMDKDE